MTLDDQEIHRVTEDLWQTMFSLDVRRLEREAPRSPKDGVLTGCVHVSGAWEGAAMLSCSTELARHVAGIMFGTTESLGQRNMRCDRRVDEHNRGPDSAASAQPFRAFTALGGGGARLPPQYPKKRPSDAGVLRVPGQTAIHNGGPAEPTGTLAIRIRKKCFLAAPLNGQKVPIAVIVRMNGECSHSMISDRNHRAMRFGIDRITEAAFALRMAPWANALRTRVELKRIKRIGMTSDSIPGRPGRLTKAPSPAPRIQAPFTAGEGL